MSNEDALIRFRHKIKVDPKTGCWLWQRATNAQGYGIGYFGTTYKTVTAHRMAYKLFNGEIPEGIYICHTCDVRNCANPDHLFLGTAKDNMEDCTSKKRHHNQQKTHCPKGHEYTHENTLINKQGRRNCRTCMREYQRKRSKQ